MMFTTSLSIDKINVFGIRFIENSIIDNKKSRFRMTRSLTSSHKVSVSGGCLEEGE